MMDNISYIKGPAQVLIIIHHLHVSTASPSKGGGGLEGRIGLPALQPVPCLSGSCMGREGHGHLVYQIYLVYRELCHLVQYTCPIVLPLISGLQTFKQDEFTKRIKC